MANALLGCRCQKNANAGISVLGCISGYNDFYHQMEGKLFMCPRVCVCARAHVCMCVCVGLRVYILLLLLLPVAFLPLAVVRTGFRFLGRRSSSSMGFSFEKFSPFSPNPEDEPICTRYAMLGWWVVQDEGFSMVPVTRRTETTVGSEMGKQATISHARVMLLLLLMMMTSWEVLQWGGTMQGKRGAAGAGGLLLETRANSYAKITHNFQTLKHY